MSEAHGSRTALATRGALGGTLMGLRGDLVRSFGQFLVDLHLFTIEQFKVKILNICYF